MEMEKRLCRNGFFGLLLGSALTTFSRLRVVCAKAREEGDRARTTPKAVLKHRSAFPFTLLDVPSNNVLETY
jgi:hypothetical protein